MLDRIGTLHLDYRMQAHDTLASARAPGLDRALGAGLAQALDSRLSSLLVDTDTVVVIRELEAAVVLGSADIALDRRVVDRVGASAAEAVMRLLGRDPSPDACMRFADQAAYVGSFIVALLDGSAWSHWYFGAFRRHRRADSADTLRAVLADCGAAVPRVLGWLAHRGHLPAVLALVPAHDVRRACAAPEGPGPAPADGTPALTHAARRLLAALDPGLSDATHFDSQITRFLAAAPIPVDWSGARAPSARALELVRWVRGSAARIDAAALPARAAAVRALLAGPLDWLDARWLESELIAPEDGAGPLAPAAHGAGAAGEGASTGVLTARQERALDRLVRAVAERRPPWPAQADADALVVWLVAWLAGEESGHGSGAPDRGVVAVIERAVHAALESAPRSAEPSAPQPDRGAQPRPAAERLAAPALVALRGAGPAALRLYRALLATLHAVPEAGAPTCAAGIFLLARAVQDLRLIPLAERCGIAPGPLLGVLADLWLGAPMNGDAAIALWTGGDDRDPQVLDAAALQRLNDGLADRLADRGVLPADSVHEAIAAEATVLERLPDRRAPAEAQLARCACLLVRAWACWLPGMSAARTPFLLERCVRRLGTVRVQDHQLFVELAPAPLDVVLQMAGYYAPLERVPWLGDRAISFSVGGAP